MHSFGRMPSDVDGSPSLFDRFATAVARFVSKAWFFAFCVGLVVGWAPSYFLIEDSDTWQLLINTTTTIVTFLMVALLQNTQQRTDDAVHRKLNAVSAGLAVLLEPGTDERTRGQARRELRAAVGLESRESS